ncbi:MULTISPECIES: septal ring lytic transglycosylase RlpA family protein [Vibrio]|uniref:Endolytic peptidoglycan transglycosylase RlpA n=1 Tax=Vibrio algicola TaxID=2662262 RepID=A0A5Q0TBH6_9VIBR|nr:MULTISPECIES: septal ring lytic transglycosylase RlpA family protein [Vibrio]MBD1575029.1 septal ring lytic transglycosylase RlpA family protein [Vibrio sp. S11_S32]
MTLTIYLKRLTSYALISVLLILAGCSSSNDRYKLSDDVAPQKPLSVSHVEDAHPRYEPFSRSGNRDYTLRGKDYKIVKETKGFTQTGYASWYGKKFHGHLTSNGEVYDMYSMSAAHKTLPIPSYVRVTNTDNGKTVIVRVNDRGPFHEGRIIDLSYAAAYKLGVYQAGTAPVKVEYITTPKTKVDQAYSKDEYLIQVAAISNKNKAETLAKQLGQTYSAPYSVVTQNKINRIMLGPWKDQDAANAALLKLQSSGYQTAFMKHQTRK